MSLTTDIYDALAIAVAAFAESRSLPVAYPGIPFNPPDSGLWLEVMVFWSESQNYGTNQTGPTVEQGFFRVVVNQRPGSRLMVAQSMAEEVVSAFAKGTRLGPALVYRMPTLSGPFQEDTRMELPVTVWWRSTR